MSKTNIMRKQLAEAAASLPALVAAGMAGPAMPQAKLISHAARAIATDLATDGFAGLVRLLPGAMAALCAELVAIEEQMKALQALGLIRARPEWRPSKRGDYLTLVYPPDAGGKRPRRYIGKDPAKISAALAGTERAEQYDQLARRLQLLQGASCAAYCQVHELVRTLTTPR